MPGPRHKGQNWLRRETRTEYMPEMGFAVSDKVLTGLVGNFTSVRVASLNYTLTTVMESLWVRQPCRVMVATDGKIGQSWRKL